jgi:hypothetical protein
LDTRFANRCFTDCNSPYFWEPVTDQERGITITCGVSRSGKTTFNLRYLVNAPIAFRFIFDPDSGSQKYANRLECDSARTAYELDKQLCQGWVLFDPHTMFPGELEEALNFFCEWAWLISQRLPGRKVLLVDEVWRYVSPNKYPKELAYCVQSGAGHGLHCLFATQTPEKLPGAIQGQASEIVCFQFGDAGEKGLEWAERRGFDPDELKRLPKLHYVARNVDTGGELRGAIEI